VQTKVDRIQIDYDLKFETPFHCGTGIREGLVDRTIVRDSEGYLYVPGSTFKGVLRERCEQLARLYEQDERMKQLVQSPHNAKAALQGLGQTVTMVTRIFGSQMVPGRLFFDDARQEEEDKLQYDSPERGGGGKYKGLQVDLYTQVRLDRPTRTAVQGALYTSEFGVRDITFKGSILGWLECITVDSTTHACFENIDKPQDAPTYSLLLLLAGVCMIERLGGNKSTGKGKCRCEVTRVMVNTRECGETIWRSWLEQLEALSYYYLY
jgi:CRISPR/Cas system CMR subunit Cmr4 (Cas7 group RAMP superfamily)